MSFHGSTVSSLRLACSQSTSGLSILIPASTFFWRHGEQARRGLFTFTPSRPTRKVSSIVSNPILLELQVDVGWTIQSCKTRRRWWKTGKSPLPAATFLKRQPSENNSRSSGEHSIWLDTSPTLIWLDSDLNGGKQKCLIIVLPYVSVLRMSVSFFSISD